MESKKILYMAIGLVLGILFAAINIYLEKGTYTTLIYLRLLSINNAYEINFNNKEFINYINFKPNKEFIVEKVSENENQGVILTNGIESAKLDKFNTVKLSVSASSKEESYNISVKLSEHLCNLYTQIIFEYIDVITIIENKSVTVNSDSKKNIISKIFKPKYYVEIVENNLISKKDIKIILYSAIFGMIFGIILGTKKITNIFKSR